MKGVWEGALLDPRPDPRAKMVCPDTVYHYVSLTHVQHCQPTLLVPGCSACKRKSQNL